MFLQPEHKVEIMNRQEIIVEEMLSRVGVRTDAVDFLRPASLSWKVTQIKTGANGQD
jgi:hypothetical protein